MSTSASLVTGADGSTTKAGSSSGVSSKADRAIFLARRREFDVILIGGNTARTEPYTKTPIPVIIISRSDVNPLSDNPKAHVWNTSPSKAIERARKEFGPHILIEGGVCLINDLLSAKLIDEFFLTVTAEINGENHIDWREILNNFAAFEKSESEGTLFFRAHN